MDKALKKIIIFISIILVLLCMGMAIYFYKINIDTFSPNISVQFDAEGYDIDESLIKIKKGNCVELPVLTKEGYDFEGWFYNGTLWESNTPIVENIVLTPKFTPKKFRITFVVDGENFYADCDYDSIPEFPEGEPTKNPTASTQFDFVGYSPSLEKVSGEATYYAVFDEVTRKFNVVVLCDEENACSFNYDEKVEYNNNANISVSVSDGYNFVGWFENDSLISSEKTVIISNVKSDINLVAKVEVIEYELTYYAPAGVENLNITTYNVKMGNVLLSDVSLDGFNFKGWFTQSDGLGEKIVVLNLDVVKFNRTFYAYFTERLTVKLVVDGLELSFDEIDVKMGEKISAPQVNTSLYGMGAQTIVGWWTQSDLNESSKFDFNTTTINENLTLYGKWKYVLDTGFFEYLDEFNSAKTSKNILIDSEEKLISFIEFVEFYEITENNAISIKFGTKNSDFKVKFDVLDDLASYVQSVINKSEFPGGVKLAYKYYNSSPYTLTSIYVSQGLNTTLKNADQNNSGTSEQYEYAFLLNTSGRSADFDDFNIDKIKDTISVSSSSQLVYCLEHGYRPICVSGSGAENVYNKAKDVLRNICDDEMTEFEKIKAIYDWLVLNVSYDNVAASTQSVLNNWSEYDAWYPEGVFNNHKAVCDGIARSLIILARIENIGAIRVEGLHNGSGHAWNKVLIDGNWYGIDATHGSPVCSSDSQTYEILTYSNFLFSDEFKQTCCTYEIKEGTETSTKLNVYSLMQFGEGNSSFDLYINSKSEMQMLALFVKSYAKNEDYYEGETNHNYFTIEFVLATNSGVTINYACTLLGKTRYLQDSVENGLVAYCFVMSFS